MLRADSGRAPLKLPAGDNERRAGSAGEKDEERRCGNVGETLQLGQ